MRRSDDKIANSPHFDAARRVNWSVIPMLAHRWGSPTWRMHEPQSLRVPLMIPELPTHEALTPYLRRIDQNRWYSNFGALVGELEERLAAEFGRADVAASHVVSIAVIELALRALQLPRGAPGRVPAVTFVATATALLSAGLTPIVADVDSRSWLLTPAIAEAALRQSAVRAVVPVATSAVLRTHQARTLSTQKMASRS